jgi:hypothetical protein
MGRRRWPQAGGAEWTGSPVPPGAGPWCQMAACGWPATLFARTSRTGSPVLWLAGGGQGHASQRCPRYPPGGLSGLRSCGTPQGAGPLATVVRLRSRSPALAAALGGCCDVWLSGLLYRPHRRHHPGDRLSGAGRCGALDYTRRFGGYMEGRPPRCSLPWGRRGRRHGSRARGLAEGAAILRAPSVQLAHGLPMSPL